MIQALVFAAGLVVGSFLNVCVWRLPRKESIVRPRSHCCSCNRMIPWYDNIPLVSYIILRGRCRFCKEKISPRYFMVELLTASLFLLLFSFYGLSVSFAVFAALAAALIAVSFVDMAIQEIPDEISLPGIALGPMLCFLYPEILSQPTHLAGFGQSLLGILAGGSLIYLMGTLGEAMFKKEAMGGGDVKLMAMIGAFLGWKLTVLAFFIAPFFGSVVGIATKIRKKEDTIPYGPHLSLAALTALLWGDKILKIIFPY